MAGINGPFETERLLLRRAVADDVDDFIALNSDPEVMRFIGNDGQALAPGSAEAGEKAAKHLALATRDDGLGIWILEWRDSPGFLGWAGLFELPDSDHIEVGYRLKKSAWGQGVATEAARFLLTHGFDVLGLSQIVAVTYPDNMASRAVLEKIGLGYLGIRQAYDMDVAYYELKRP